jgi:hypothetical protein
MPPRLCIVSAYRPDVFEEAVNALSLGQNIEVIMDRRIGERRAPGRADSASDRRRYDIDEELRTEGYAFVE